MSHAVFNRVVCVGAFLLFVSSSNAYSQSVVRVFGNWPPDGFCVRSFKASPARQGIDGACNDKTSGVEVPFGMSVEICEHDGHGSSGLGNCRRFLPGTYFVGTDFNDIASTFLVENKMFAYLNSADLPTSWKVGVNLSGPTGGPLKPGMIIGSDGGGMTMSYDIPLPPSCPKPTFHEMTKANDANWSGQVVSGRLKLNLRVAFKSPFGANNWVGVDIRC